MELPSQEEVEQLPRWARVVFAARRARRLQPLFAAGWSNAPEEHRRSVEAAITLAFRAAGGDARAAAAAEAAARAATAACHATAAHARHPAAEAAEAAATAAHVAAHAVYGYPYVVADDAAAGACRYDYEILLAAARRESWGDDKAVPAAICGPLWPFGEPPGWPSIDPEWWPEAEPTPAGPRTLQLTIELPADTDDADIVGVVRELAKQADALHAAYGGAGLTIENVEVETPSLVPAGVGP